MPSFLKRVDRTKADPELLREVVARSSRCTPRCPPGSDLSVARVEGADGGRGISP
jgi:hypothetical protein